MKITEVLDQLKKKSPKALTEKIKENIAKIKKISDSKFNNQLMFGNAALNRKSLLNTEIASLLTPDVIEYLFTNEPNDQTKVERNSGGPKSIRDVIYYGFSDGLHIIKLMPNNESDYNPDMYTDQKKQFQSNIMDKIAKNIMQASGIPESEMEQEKDFYKISLKDQLDRIINTVKELKTNNKSAILLDVPGFSPKDMRNQVGWGFTTLCHKSKVVFKNNEIKDHTLDSFCEEFLKSPEALLDGSVIHLFYDRAHFEAALEQDTKIKIGGIDYTYTDIFKTIVNKIVDHPNDYPDCAKEQFYLRLQLVENDLNLRFPAEKRELTSTEQEGLNQRNIDESSRLNIIVSERQRVTEQSLDVPKEIIKTPENEETIKTPQEEKFDILRIQILSKVTQLAAIDRNASGIAYDLYMALAGATRAYRKNKDYEKFKNACDTAINDARPVLQQHRGWTHFFVKLTLAILSIGTIPAGLAIISKIKTGSYSFRLFDTDSSKKLDKLKEAVAEIDPKKTPGKG